MSRIGKKPVTIPNGVKAELKDLALKITGPKGNLTVVIHPKVLVTVSENEILVDVANKENKLERSLWGLTRSLIANAVTGVVSGFEKKLEINGVGYRGTIAGKTITLALGFSHPVIVEVPEGLTAVMEKNVITITGIDKQAVGEFAAKVRALKKPEPYKGKGIKYSDEIVRRKAGKVVKAVGGK
ncbi:MAG: large subunit ribosomal protein L6 [Candidatus Doudnabacteria bacterium Gr01-1014_77]|uniref:Large ribosomal subunit protein uL6 n=1 Tax=Candidatus Doudnabacteria bacterium Gr01-1014_77 TaxID=2017133 RepID=A0A554J998_9BACT|nr:MAG: large subunit ribosomal protein L6 [Candidatus Doudnabacteria bacterium Gr01-1014_77]